jgi:hypothetical protein
MREFTKWGKNEGEKFKMRGNSLNEGYSGSPAAAAVRIQNPEAAAAEGKLIFNFVSSSVLIFLEF